MDQERQAYSATSAGVVGSLVSLLCCAGVAPVLGVLSAIGLGFVLTDAILIPLLVASLGVTLWGLRQGRRCHGRASPLTLGLVGSIAAVAGVFAWIPLAFAGLAAVLAAGIWNVLAVRACAVGDRAPATAGSQIVNEGS